MKEQKLKLLLYLKKLEDRKGRRGQGLIMARLTLDGERIQFSTRIYCSISLWSSRAGKLVGKSTEAETVNPQLDAFRLRLLKAYDSLRESGRTIQLEDLKRRIIGRTLDRLSLLSYMYALIKQYEGMPSKEFNRGAHLNTIGNLKRFLTYKGLGEDIPLEAISPHLLENFVEYLILERKLSPNYILAVLSPLRRTWRELQEEHPDISSPFDGANIQIKTQVYDNPRYLSADELKALCSLLLPEELQTARDMFLFACYTGMSFVDLTHLRIEQMTRDNKDVLWLRYSRVKTGQDCSIPLLPKAIGILHSYRRDRTAGLLFPEIKYADYLMRLHTLGMMIGLSSKLTSHVARHTFATLMTLEQGVSIESVSSMLGHSRIEMTERYAHVTPQKVFSEFARFESYISDIDL